MPWTTDSWLRSPPSALPSLPTACILRPRVSSRRAYTTRTPKRNKLLWQGSRPSRLFASVRLTGAEFHTCGIHNEGFRATQSQHNEIAADRERQQPIWENWPPAAVPSTPTYFVPLLHRGERSSGGFHHVPRMRQGPKSRHSLVRGSIGPVQYRKSNLARHGSVPTTPRYRRAYSRQRSSLPPQQHPCIPRSLQTDEQAAPQPLNEPPKGLGTSPFL